MSVSIDRVEWHQRRIRAPQDHVYVPPPTGTGTAADVHEDDVVLALGGDRSLTNLAPDVLVAHICDRKKARAQGSPPATAHPPTSSRTGDPTSRRKTISPSRRSSTRSTSSPPTTPGAASPPSTPATCLRSSFRPTPDHRDEHPSASIDAEKHRSGAATDAARR